MDFILKKAKNPVTAVLLAAAGIFAGLALGSLMVRLYFSGGNPAIYLFTEPDVEYRFIRERMESPSAEDRAVAYYALVEYGRADAEFLIERYRAEKSALVKRVIVWSLASTGEGDIIAEFIRREYSVSEPPVKREMIRTLGRIGGAAAESLSSELRRPRP